MTIGVVLVYQGYTGLKKESVLGKKIKRTSYIFHVPLRSKK